MAETDSIGAPQYRIGAVAKMTGIPADTLRAWERRYAAVEPDREAGVERLYTRSQVKRLTLLKQLVDRGHAIGSVANLSDAELADRLELHQTQHAASGPRRVVVWGDVIPLRLRRAQPHTDGVEFAGLCRSRAEFESAVDQHRPDVLLFEFPVLDARLAEELLALYRRSGAHTAIVIYGFATRAIVDSLTSDGFLLLQGTASVSTVLNVLRRLQAQPPGTAFDVDDLEALSSPPDRLFSNEALAQASMLTSKVACECPRHLADLILRLEQFEMYSAGCQNRNQQDAELHAVLKNAAGHARALMEAALKYAADAEGLVLD